MPVAVKLGPPAIVKPLSLSTLLPVLTLVSSILSASLNLISLPLLATSMLVSPAAVPISMVSPAFTVLVPVPLVSKLKPLSNSMIAASTPVLLLPLTW